MKLDIHNLNKSYGDKQALKNVNISLSEGIYGLLGPNGAGKSTLMNIIAGNLDADSGTVLYNGEDILRMGDGFRSVLGFMPQQQRIYDNFTGFRFLSYIAALKGMDKKKAEEEIIKVAKRVNLLDELDKKLGGYSGGMKQRILIAQAILNEPKVLILDEPTAGLDPKERIRIKNLIAEIALDKIVILATHVVPDIEHIAKEIILLKKGEVVAKDTPQKILETLSGKVYEIITKKDKLENITKKYMVCNIGSEDENLIVRIIADQSPDGYEYRQVKANLEDKYLHVFFEDERIYS